MTINLHTYVSNPNLFVVGVLIILLYWLLSTNIFNQMHTNFNKLIFKTCNPKSSNVLLCRNYFYHLSLHTCLWFSLPIHHWYLGLFDSACEAAYEASCYEGCVYLQNVGCFWKQEVNGKLKQFNKDFFFSDINKTKNCFANFIM